MFPASQQKPSIWQVIQSVIAAMFGVQSAKARERDFQHGKPWVYVLIGLIGVTLFVLTIYGVVLLVMSNIPK